MEAVQAYLQSVIPTILIVILESILAVLGINIVRFTIKLIKRTGIEIDEKIMQEIEDIVLKAVSITNQTLTDNYKAASANGKLTDEQIEEVFNNTKDIIMSSLGHEQIQALINKFGTDIDEAVKLLIENTVYWSHNND